MLAVDRARGFAFSHVAMQGGGDGSLRWGRGEFHDSRSSGCGAGSPPAEEVEPAVDFEAAFDGEQGVGAGVRPAASRLTEGNGICLLSIRRTERCPLGLNRVSDRLVPSAGATPKRSG